MATGEELTFVVKRFIVQRLAGYYTPSQVVRAVKEEFDLTVTRQRVHFYDPTTKAGAAIAEDLKRLFFETRKKALHDYEAIPGANKAVRLARLDRMAVAAEERGNFPLAAQLNEQLAKEAGDAFTNRHKHELTGPNGKDLAAPPAEVVIFRLPDNGREPYDPNSSE